MGWRGDEEVKSTGLGDCVWWTLSRKFDPWVSDGATGWMVGPFFEEKEHGDVDSRFRKKDAKFGWALG